jgi:hypothetical protein
MEKQKANGNEAAVRRKRRNNNTRDMCVHNMATSFVFRPVVRPQHMTH